MCPECLGRLFGRLGHGLSNPGRAERLASALGRPIPPVAPEGCEICHGAFSRWESWVPRALRAAEGLEWQRFSCGSRWDPELLAREETVWVEVGTQHGESARGAFNREWGKRIEAATGHSGGPDRPDLVFLADLPVGRVSVTLLPLYFRGRYRKLDRTIPQTRWPCRRCQGSGCDDCHGTGQDLPDERRGARRGAVPRRDRRVGDPVPRDGPRGHRCEDARARPPVRPRDPGAEASYGRRPRPLGGRDAGLRGPDRAPRAPRGERLGRSLGEGGGAGKSYRVTVLGDVPVEKVNEALGVACSRAIAQRTPTRVAHRRSDLVRMRRILGARVVEAAEGRFTLDLRAEAGTYIKEWVEGDGGRTEPSLSGLLGIPLRVDALDVLDIHDQEG